MATYTTNYNLSKPENTDPQADFMSDYCDNMDKIDANMGGGGGGGATMLLNTIYSDTEKKIGYWRDNKPLYQKSFAINTSNLNTGWNDISSGLSGIDCKDITGKFRFPANDNSIYEFPYTEDSTYCLFGGYKPTNDTIFIYKGSGFATISDFVITLRYTKTADNPEPNPEFGNTIFLPTIYSEEEKEVGVWIDNKPLYQKTLKGNSDPNNTSIRVDVSALDLETICNAYLVTNSSTASTQDYYYDNSDHLRWYYDDKVNEYLTIEYGGSYPSRPFEWRLTLQYTKTTDTAGSGTWTADGAIAEHFKSNEQVIGTWVTGKPLYQKTVDVGSLPSNDTKTVAHGVANLDLIVSCKGFAYNSSYTFLSLPSINVDSLSYGVQLESDRTNITIKTKESWMNAYSGFVTIQYTKTTD